MQKTEKFRLVVCESFNFTPFVRGIETNTVSIFLTKKIEFFS